MESARNQDQPLLADMLQRLGTMYGLTQAYEASLEFHTKHLELVRAMGWRGQALAAALGNVGLAQRINKMNRAALMTFEELRRMFTHELSVTTPDYARTLMNIGLCHLADNDAQRAVEMLHAAVSVIERLEISPSDRQAAIARDELFSNITAHLGRVLFRQRNFAVAKRVVERSLRIKVTILGASHPDVLDLFSLLGHICSEIGEGDAATHFFFRGNNEGRVMAAFKEWGAEGIDSIDEFS